MTTDTTVRPAAGRGWAYLGAILGGTVSIAANIAHSYVPPSNAPADWAPQPGAVVGAIFWPIALFVAVEILARIAWPTGRGWTILRFGGLLPVALVAAVVSYRHLAGLLGYYGEDPLTVAIGPLAVDGLMIMATGALLATGNDRPTVSDGHHTSTQYPAATSTHRDHNPTSVEVEPTPANTPPVITSAPEPTPASVPAHLVPTARFVVTNHEATTGRPITAPELAARISVPDDIAGQLLTLVTPAPSTAPVRVNGTPIGGDR